MSGTTILEAFPFTKGCGESNNYKKMNLVRGVWKEPGTEKAEFNQEETPETFDLGKGIQREEHSIMEVWAVNPGPPRLHGGYLVIPVCEGFRTQIKELRDGRKEMTRQF